MSKNFFGLLFLAYIGTIDANEPVCWVQGECLGKVTHTESNVSSKDKCLSICQKSNLCNWFTYFVEREVCVLMLDCPNLDESCESCFSGESKCRSGYTKLMVVGGYDGSSDLNSVEIIDLGSSSTSCQNLANFPQAMYGAIGGLVSNNSPIICGGRSAIGYVNNCSSYKDGAWNSFPSMTTPRSYAAASPSPYQNRNHYLLVTGGSYGSSDQDTAEVLSDGGWQDFSISLPVTIWLHCMVFVNSTTVMIIGGTQNGVSSSPNTFYFNTENEKWVAGPKLLSGRAQHSCGKLQKESGSSQESVIVAGGFSESSVEILDNGASEWRTGPSLPFVIYGESMIEDSSGGVVLIAGHNGTYLNTLYQMPNANS